MNVGTSMAENVVQFPVHKRMQQIEDQKNYEIALDEDISTTSEFLVENMLLDMQDAGYTDSFDSKKLIYETSFVYESIRSLLLKMSDVEHPLQDFAFTMYSEAMQFNSIQNDKQLEFDFGDNNGTTLSE